MKLSNKPDLPSSVNETKSNLSKFEKFTDHRMLINCVSGALCLVALGLLVDDGMMSIERLASLNAQHLASEVEGQALNKIGNVLAIRHEAIESELKDVLEEINNVRECTSVELDIINSHRQFVLRNSSQFASYAVLALDIPENISRYDELAEDTRRGLANDFADARDVPVYCGIKQKDAIAELIGNRDTGNKYFVFYPLYFSRTSCQQLGTTIHEYMHFSGGYSHLSDEAIESGLVDPNYFNVATFMGSWIGGEVCPDELKGKIEIY